MDEVPAVVDDPDDGPTSRAPRGERRQGVGVRVLEGGRQGGSEPMGGLEGQHTRRLPHRLELAQRYSSGHDRALPVSSRPDDPTLANLAHRAPALDVADSRKHRDLVAVRRRCCRRIQSAASALHEALETRVHVGQHRHRSPARPWSGSPGSWTDEQPSLTRPPVFARQRLAGLGLPSPGEPARYPPRGEARPSLPRPSAPADAGRLPSLFLSWDAQDFLGRDTRDQARA